MKKDDDISRLLQRFLSGRKAGKDAYFDADEIDDLLDSFEESDDYTNYDGVLALGLRLHPGNSDLQVRQCKLYVYEDEYDSALALIETLSETDNQDLDMLRLECYVMLERYDDVVKYTDQLIVDECDYLEDVFEYVAQILDDMDMTKEAHDYIRRGLLLFPDNLVLKDELCFCLEAEGNIGQAIEVCNELIDQNPYSYDYWFTLGRLYSINADFEKAIEAFDFALTCDDSDEELKVLKAYCLYMNENYEKAVEIYNDIIESDLEATLRIAPLLAECYIKMEEYEKAYSLLKEQISSADSASDATTYINYIRCCVETDRENEASEVLTHASELFPDNVRLLSLMALTCLENEDELGAKEMTDRLFKALDQRNDTFPEDVESLYRAGQYLYMKGNADGALKYYKKVLEINPEMPYMHLHLAMAYLAKGDMLHFSEHYRQTNPEEVVSYLKNAGLNLDGIKGELAMKHIAPEDLVSEFLKNNDNKN